MGNWGTSKVPEIAVPLPEMSLAQPQSWLCPSHNQKLILLWQACSVWFVYKKEFLISPFGRHDIPWTVNSEALKESQVFGGKEIPTEVHIFCPYPFIFLILICQWCNLKQLSSSKPADLTWFSFVFLPSSQLTYGNPVTFSRCKLKRGDLLLLASL